ncbi:MAG: hypothetical protein ACYC6M_09255 [Terriglobales bacterium]
MPSLAPVLVRTSFPTLLAIVFGVACLVTALAGGILEAGTLGAWCTALVVAAGTLFAAAGIAARR